MSVVSMVVVMGNGKRPSRVVGGGAGLVVRVGLRAQAPAPLVAPRPPGRGREAHARQARCSCFNAQAVAAPDLLQALLTASGPSGHEEEPAHIWREEAASFAEVSSDTLGTSFARVPARDGAPTLAIVGH